MTPTQKLIAILDQFVVEPELGVREIGRRTGISKSAVQRLASELLDGGLLAKTPDSPNYRLGLRMLTYGVLVQARSELLTVARPVLRSLAQLSGENVHLRILHNGELIGVDHVESVRGSGSYYPFAHAPAAYLTGLGKAVLAFQPDGVVEEVIRKGVDAPEPDTLASPDKLRRELRRIREQGYAIGDLRIGVNSVGAPIRWPNGAVNAGMSISGPASRMTRPKLLQLVEPLLAGANEIARGLSS